ncbi:MAG TPA: PAS domain S-box protein [Gemmatimonadaceae bacterium]|nr:PAS domain S-box protein [Gemmatimonadaceae bacterium]
MPTQLRDTHFDPLTATLLDSIEQGVVVYDLGFRYQIFNRYMERLSGMKADEVVGRDAFELFPHLKVNGVDKLLNRAIKGETVRSGEVPYHVAATDRSGWVVGLYSPLRDFLGECIGVVGIIQDVTDRKRVEDSVRHSERWFRSIIENSSEMVIVVDVDGSSKYVSPSCKRVLGVEPRDVVGRQIFEFVHPEDVRAVQLEFARLLEQRGAATPLEFRIRNVLGGWRTVLVTARNLMHDPHVYGVIITARDITDQKALELQFQHMQKMEAVGRLASGVAHDFNNLLSVIQGNAQLALRSMNAESPGHDEIREIGLAADRAGVLTRQLLTFSRQQPLSMEELRPNAVIEEIERLLRRLLGDDVKLALSLEALGGCVRADRGQLEQVLMNLVVNARDAIAGSGKVEIATGDTELKQDFVRMHPGTKAGKYVVIAVSDTGCGMSPEVKGRIFEPFFTTKQRGKGTGLGLSTVYGIVQQCGGFLLVDSEPGRGSTFKIYLPRVD